jgi:hypothetical protein
VNRSQRILVFGGLCLAALGMLYGLHYAVFVEHQTLDRMGGSLAQGFMQAAQRDMPGAHALIDSYAAVKYDYVRQVDIHSHWIGLAMIMIVLGAAFGWVGFSERIRTWVAIGFALGSFLFPLGVVLQTAPQMIALGRGLAIVGSGLVTIALAAVAWGFSRQAAE